ncbi:MAG: sigma 54-interacting transcriptional regulator, partial [Candidatus Saganbacteria bacterium]|nr:sigma 54-interacting transcriptional regulator [Candidatus Saganbacteria bacterium]
ILQEKEFERLGGTQTIKADARVICATHRDLENMLKEGKFREDLYYRINVFPVNLPPLRDKKEDIPLLVDSFIEKYNKENKKKIKGINRAALDMLMAYHWPGNVRELENVIERAVVLCQKDLISVQELPANLQGTGELNIPSGSMTLPELVGSIEKQKIIDALQKHKTQKAASKALGITERMLGYKIKNYNIVV